MALFGATQGCGWGGGIVVKKATLPKFCHTHSTKIKSGIVIPYLKKTLKIYESCNIHLEFS